MALAPRRTHVAYTTVAILGSLGYTAHVYSPPISAHAVVPTVWTVEDDIDYAWRKVADDLERRIRSGELAYNAQLRVRGGLTVEYGHSDRTIRHAIDELVKRGLVKVLDGKGTFVSWRPEAR